MCGDKVRNKMVQNQIVNDAWARLDDEDGILVTGGVDADNQPLASVEFFSIPKQVSDQTRDDIEKYEIFDILGIVDTGRLDN